jgi:hypothetical protein
MSLLRLALFAGAAGCAGSPPEPTPPECDGLLQPGEGDVVDSVFDADGDGFVDGADEGCAAVFAIHALDCDDGDPAVHPEAGEVPCNGVDDDCAPDTADAGGDNDGDGVGSCDDCDDEDAMRFPGATEVCWDGIDNDCDGAVDPECGPDYNGQFRLDTRVVQACGLGYVDIDFDVIELRWDPPQATALPTPGVSPPNLTGTIEPDGTFVLEAALVVGTAGACDEYYRLSGRFDGPDRFTAQFEAVFLGLCLNCQDMTVPDIAGERY